MAMKKKLVQAAAGAGSEPDLFILSVLGNGTPYFNDIAVDSSNNIVTVGNVNDTSGFGGNDGLILKADASGNVLWSTITGGTSNDLFRGVSVDASNNIYAVGSITETFEKSYIQKVSGSGTILWEKNIFSTSSRQNALYDCDISSDGSTLFIAGISDDHNFGTNTSVDGFYYGSLATSDGSGLVDYTEGWTYSIGARVVAVNGDGFVTFAGKTGETSAGYVMDFFVRASQSNINTSTETFPFGGQTSAYVADVAHGPSNETWAIISGNRSWYAKMSGTTVNTIKINNLTSGAGRGAVTDSDGNVYFLSYCSTVGNRNTFIVKFDVNFNLVWSKRLRSSINSAHQIVPTKIAISNNGQHLYVCGIEQAAFNGTYAAMIFKFPTDGSLTGTYGNFVYEDFAANISNASQTSRTNAASKVSSTVAIANSTVTTNTFTPTSINLEEG